jgi:Na+-translocating ferredoxin:NAD+ oxidoreductase RnfD subunit
MEVEVEAAAPALRVGGRSIPVVLPDRRDPRLRLAVVILSLQALGQFGLGFRVSIAQILVSIGTCALIELVVVLFRERKLAWPASAMLTGNSVAFILRTPGTHHGDWWSLSGVELFIAASVISMLSKYVIRPGGRHRFNPSNLGLVLVFLLLGPQYAFPQYLWWGSLDLPVVLALAVMVAGGLWVLWPLRLLPMVIAFLVTFWAATAGLAATGRCFLAIWSTTPVCGTAYWLNLATSPELLVFVFFMITDPMTAPRGGGARILFGILVGGVSAALIATQPSEFGVKVALLAGLTLVCAAVPWIDRGSRPAPAPGPRALRVTAAGVVALLIAAAVPLGVLARAGDPVILATDRNPAIPAPSGAPTGIPQGG